MVFISITFHLKFNINFKQDLYVFTQDFYVFTQDCKFSSRTYIQLSRCSTARGSCYGSSLVGPTKVKAHQIVGTS